jgi:hypothetical protein
VGPYAPSRVEVSAWETASAVTEMPSPSPTFRVAVPEVAPPVKPLPAVTPVISPVPVVSFL